MFYGLWRVVTLEDKASQQPFVRTCGLAVSMLPARLPLLHNPALHCSATLCFGVRVRTKGCMASWPGAFNHATTAPSWRAVACVHMYVGASPFFPSARASNLHAALSVHACRHLGRLRRWSDVFDVAARAFS